MDCVSAGKVFVQLFFQTQPKYQLNNRKLQYLLCIAQMSRLSYGETLFDEDFRNLKYGFTLDAIADTFINKTNIVDGKITTNPLEYSIEKLVVPFKCKQIYSLKELVLEKDAELIKSVFIRFGGYDEKTLCNLLDEFKVLKESPVFEVVPKEDVTEYFLCTFKGKEDVNNSIFSFCREKHDEALYVSEEDGENAKVSAQEHPAVAETVLPQSVQEPVSENLEEVEKPIVKTVVPKRDFLKKFSSLPVLSIGKNCCVLIEVDSNKVVEDVCVFATALNQRIQGTLCRVNDNIYRYSFVSVASDVKISATVVEK